MSTVSRYSKILPKYYRPRDCWVIDIPTSLGGKRMRRFYPDEASALRGSAEIALQIELGASPAPMIQATNLNALAASYLAEQEFLVGYDTLRQLRWALKKFTAKFGTMQPDQVTASMIKSWVAQLPLQTRGRFNAFSCVRSFYNSPSLRAAYGNPCLDSPRKQDRNHRLEILTVAQARMLVQADFPCRSSAERMEKVVLTS